MDEELTSGFASAGFLDNSGLASELTLTTDQTYSFDESKDREKVVEENLTFNPLVSFIQSKFQRAKDQRRASDEPRWLQAHANYRGVYGPEVAFTDNEKSRAFIKITKTKVLAAYAQILDIIFSGNKFPIGVEASPVPLGVAESVHFDPKSPENQAKKMGPAGGAGGVGSAAVARPDILQQIGSLFTKRLEPVQDMVKEGPGLTPTSYTFEPAKEAAKLLERKIQDQLFEANASKSIRSFVFDLCAFGEGVFKGPFLVEKEYPKWDKTGKYTPLFQKTADLSHVPLFDAYPDPDARNMEEAEFFIQRHRLSKTQLRELKKRPAFRHESIDIAISQGANYQREYWENILQESDVQTPMERFEVLEYWGILDEDIAKEVSLEIPKEYKDRDQVQVNAWICNGQVLRLVLNPFTPARIPFYACPYELNPYSFFGIGVAENMEDSQLIMNGAFRSMIDNGILSGNVIFEVDETNLVGGQDMKLSPGKVFRRQGGAPGQSIFATKFPNVTNEWMQIFDKARQLADESTGMPSYAHGVSGVMGVGRTASGMSMLMGAAKENIKAVIRNLDDYLFVPLGRAMFAFNMQFNFSEDFIGDVSIVARGTESLMRNEVLSQKLLQFLQIASNPMDAPFIKRDYIFRELAQTLDLDPEKVVNDPREAGVQAEMLAKMQQAMGIPPQAPQGQGNAAGAPAVSDPTGSGGGNIGPGMAPEPGAAGFTGAGGGNNGGQSTPPERPA